MSNTKNQIRKALIKHQADVKAVKFCSPAYYYANTMIERCQAALKIEDDVAAWKYFQG